MKSKWYELKQRALLMRKTGSSLREVSNSLAVPKSTLSGWFSNLELSQELRTKLRERQLLGLQSAREQAVIWHHNQKELNIKRAEFAAAEVFSKINAGDQSVSELALAMLYLGEGFKSRTGLGMGNSDPMILKFFISMLLKIYKLDVNRIKCELHLRADQDPDEKKKYWSEQLGIDLGNFTSVSFDQRTVGSKSYSTYNGVCAVRCSSIAIQRKLMYLAKQFCEEVTDRRAVSSAGRASH